MGPRDLSLSTPLFRTNLRTLVLVVAAAATVIAITILVVVLVIVAIVIVIVIASVAATATAIAIVTTTTIIIVGIITVIAMFVVAPVTSPSSDTTTVDASLSFSSVSRLLLSSNIRLISFVGAAVGLPRAPDNERDARSFAPSSTT